jgi:2-polyprenyl-6-methoxyphenol hydroxylase-like FAD-dependent oxidoreductase
LKPIHITGGGLAGLSVGIALQNAGVPVTITEAGDYPRHRVCGEFINGAGQRSLEGLGLGDVLDGSMSNLRTAWYGGNRFLFSGQLPAPALGLSRFQLDQRLASRFEDNGGTLITRTRTRQPPDGPGAIWACGRVGSSRQWIGLKLHCTGLRQANDLGMHLGSNGYVGLSRIEGGKINVCGLFRLQRHLAAKKSGLLVAYLRANGLTDLADQLDQVEIDPASVSATTALDFTDNLWPGQSICLGDSNSAIPPFTGNGMSMALESAHTAFPVLLRYARAERSWADTRLILRRALARRFRLRLAAARLIHDALLHSVGQQTLIWTASRHLLPFNLLYRLLR